MFRSQCLHAQWGWKEPECCKTGKKYHFFIITLETMVYSLRTPAFQLNFCVLIFFFFFFYPFLSRSQWANQSSMLSSKLRYGNKHTKNCNDFSKIIFLSYTKICSQKQFLAEHMNDKSAQLGLSQYSLSLSLSLFNLVRHCSIFYGQNQIIKVCFST